MRRRFRTLISAGTVLAAIIAPLPAARAQQQALPPHAFLFGSWIGGVFPASPSLPALLCHAHPTVIFTADLVLRANLGRTTYVQREITTAQAIPNGVDFRFLPAEKANDPFALAGDSNGFGCPNGDTLRVEKRGDNQIVFPNCGEFPYPLYRCGAR